MGGAYDMTVKIIFLGDYSVDKGTLVQRLSSLPEQPEVTCLGLQAGLVEMIFHRDGKRVRVKISDTAGQERYRSITSSFYRGIHGCVLLFDITQRSTFESLTDWHRQLVDNSLSEDIAVTLAGYNCHVTGSERQVTRRTAQAYADLIGVPYEEMTVTNTDTVVRLLEGIIDRIISKASRSSAISHSIKPLDQKLQERRQQEQGQRRKCAC